MANCKCGLKELDLNVSSIANAGLIHTRDSCYSLDSRRKVSLVLTFKTRLETTRLERMAQALLEILFGKLPPTDAVASVIEIEKEGLD